MHDPECMQVVEAPEELPQDNLNCILIEELALLDKIYDRPSFTELGYDLISISCLEHFIQFDNVGVIHLFQKLQLGKHLFLLVMP